MTTGNVSYLNSISGTMGVHPLFFHLSEEYSKVWSGGDSPKVEPTPKTEIIHFSPVRDRKGFVIDWKKHSRWVNYGSPRRMNKKGEHSYSMTRYLRHEDWFLINSPLYGDVTYYTDRANLSISDPWTADDDLVLYDKLREEVAGSSSNFGVTTAEAHKTLGMIRERSSDLARGLLAFKKGKFKTAALMFTKHQPKHLQKRSNRLPGISAPNQSTWLELQYGWKPLIQDVHDGARFLGHYHGNAPQSFTHRVSRSLGGVTGLQGDAHIRYFGNYELKANYIQKSSTVMKVRVTEVNYPQLSGLLDPVSIAWELTPYSFVADWIVPIGSFLSAVALKRSIKVDQVVKSHMHSWSVGTVELNQYTTGVDEGWHFVRYPSGYRHAGGSLTREVLSTLPNPPIPTMKPITKVASWMHAANAVVLVANVFRK